MTTKVSITSYNLVDFAKEIQDNVLLGYRLDLDTNENIPLALGPALFVCNMLKEGTEDKTNDKQLELNQGVPAPVQPTVQPEQKKQGRPAKK